MIYKAHFYLKWVPFYSAAKLLSKIQLSVMTTGRVITPSKQNTLCLEYNNVLFGGALEILVWKRAGMCLIWIIVSSLSIPLLQVEEVSYSRLHSSYFAWTILPSR